MRAALVIALSAVTLVQADQSQPPARDSSRPASQSSAARIRGRVIAADTGQPLGRAHVAISVPPSATRSTWTDAEGRFEFADLPGGSFLLMASKTGYVTLQYGQRRPFEQGRNVAVSAGQTMDRVDFSLPRGAVISARISDDLGFPMAGVEVRVQRYQYRSDGQRSLVQIANAIAGPTATDDRGELRVFGLMPGDYVVSAMVRAPGSRFIAGGEGYGLTFYPGVINAGQATPISVGIGEERTAQFSMVRTRLARVSGLVVDTQGRPANGANLTLSTALGDPGRALIGVDGTFEINSIGPGDYSVLLTYDAFYDQSQTLTVDGADISGLRFVVGGGTTVSGKVVFEGGAPPAATVRAVRAGLTSATPVQVPGLMPSQRSAVLDDEGAFQFTGVNGRVIIGANAPQGWILKSVVADGRDVTDQVIDLGGRARLPDVVVTMTNRLTALSGQVTDARSQPAAEYVVVIVPVDLYPPVVMAQRVKALRPGPAGTFTAQGMRPGRYVALAVEALEQGRDFSPEFQQQVRRLGHEFTLGEGQTASLNLRLTPDL